MEDEGAGEKRGGGDRVSEGRIKICKGHSADFRSASFKCLRNALISIKIEFRNHGQTFSELKMPYDVVVAADFADQERERIL